MKPSTAIAGLALGVALSGCGGSQQDRSQAAAPRPTEPEQGVPVEAQVVRARAAERMMSLMSRS